MTGHDLCRFPGYCVQNEFESQYRQQGGEREYGDGFKFAMAVGVSGIGRFGRMASDKPGNNIVDHVRE